MFRPCIDLHDGKVKQIVGGTLDATSQGLRTNFISDRPASYYAELYKMDRLTGGHVILLGPGNEPQALEALRAYPGGLQLGGGVNAENASSWLEAGASHVIVTSWVFHDGTVDMERLRLLHQIVGRERLVLDLSCRKRDGCYYVVTDRWKKFTEVTISQQSLESLSQWCSEFLVHAVDVEGLCRGIDEELVGMLAGWCPVPVTYAGGARSIEDLKKVQTIGQGRVDLTIGSALDIFGGVGIKYSDAVAFNNRMVVKDDGQKG